MGEQEEKGVEEEEEKEEAAHRKKEREEKGEGEEKRRPKGGKEKTQRWKERKAFLILLMFAHFSFLIYHCFSLLQRNYMSKHIFRKISDISSFSHFWNSLFYFFD